MTGRLLTARVVAQQLGLCTDAPSTFNSGYGRLWRDGENVLAHRWAWEQAHGEIPNDLQVHHLCQNKRCMNVAHLALRTPRDHKHEHLKTHCPQGHPYAGENLHINPGGFRVCKTCKREKQGLEELQARPCAICGAEFMPKRRRDARYCSSRCRARARKLQ